MRPLTLSCFLLLVLGRLFLLALPFLGSTPWNPPLFTVESTLTFLCSRSDPPLSLAGMQLSPTLTLSPLMIWYSGLTALFLFILAGAAPACLPTALSVVLRPLFPFQQARFVPVFPLGPAPFCMLFAGLGSTNWSAISLLFLSNSRSVLTTLSSPPSFRLSETLLQIWQELSSLSSCSIRLQWVLGHSFFPGNDAADELARRGALLAPSATPCSLSTLPLSRIGGVLSHQNSLTHRFPRFPPRNLCSLVMLAVPSLVYAATDTAFF